MIWGTTFVVSDTALDSMSPAALTVTRFVLALLVLAPVAMRRGGFAAAIRSPPVAVLGATGVAAYYGLQNLGLVTTGAGTAAVLQAGLPLATSVIAWVWLGERLTRGLLAGLALATIGVALVAGQAAAEATPGAALVATGVLAYAAYTVLLRKQPHHDSIVLAAATCTWGVIFLLPWLMGEILAGSAHVDLDPPTTVTVLYLGFFGSALTLFLWTYGASRVPASTAGVFTAAIPAVGYVCALTTGEPGSWAKTVGCAFALVGAGIAAHVSSTDGTLTAKP